MRASDAERDEVVGQLRERFAEGRLSQETFLYRMDVALRAKERSELSDLLHDLPGMRAVRSIARPPATGVMTRLRQAVTGRLGAARRPAPGQAALGQPAPGQAAPGRRVSRRQAVAEQPEPPPLCLPPHQKGRFTIGRALACDFTLADLSVSRWHAKLDRDEEHWMLSDLGSTNGTRLNGWRVTTGVPVQPGDRVSFGSVTFVITDRPVSA
jgi:Inner membrane component of T3SS, cytoplasmic domain/Domain of unknown function (DUF1707)